MPKLLAFHPSPHPNLVVPIFHVCQLARGDPDSHSMQRVGSEWDRTIVYVAATIKDVTV